MPAVLVRPNLTNSPNLTMFNHANLDLPSFKNCTFNNVAGGQNNYYGPPKGKHFYLLLWCRGHHFVISFLVIDIPDLKHQPMPKRCPAPTNFFKGRKNILESLHRWFVPSPTSVESGKQRRFVLYGLGGGGKTQIALKFVKECQNETQPQRCASSLLTCGSSS